MKYRPVIGLEIHCELLTKSKVFCSCENVFGGGENTRVCPRCSGMPGTLPSINRGAVMLAAKAGFATDCTVHRRSSFDRKNYFYPDLPKAYQITQFFEPICTDGHITVSDGTKIRINRIHIEEDAGKLVHNDCEGISMADYNRCGVPLIEIVTEPDFRTVEQVRDFVKKIALRLKYADVCDAKPEQGSLRVDVNISLMPLNSDKLGTRAEIKNINSIKSIGRAIESEIRRQSKILDSGEEVIHETRRYNEKLDNTVSMRSKEEAHDYRYFPEPDIPPLIFTDEELSEIKNSMPEMPHKRFERYIGEYGLSSDDALLIIADRAFSDFYDEAVNINPDYKQISKLLLGEISHCINESGKSITASKITPIDIADIALMLTEGQISAAGAREIAAKMFSAGGNAREIAENCGFIMNSGIDGLEEIIDNIILSNPESVLKYRSGNDKLFSFFMGQTLRQVGKSANPQAVKALILKKLEEGID